MSESVVEIKDLSFGYHAKTILENANLVVHERELVALLGPNGGGKTTLLRLMLGLETPNAGTVSIFGEPPANARRRIGYVAQSLHFDPQFPVTTSEVVQMGRVERRRFGPFNRADRKAASHALDHVGLKDLEKRPFSELSGGERQRVLIARALCAEPELLLMDEPTANVDFRVEEMLYDLLETLNQQLTIVIVSHAVGRIAKYAQRLVWINRSIKSLDQTDITTELLQQMYGETPGISCGEPDCQVTAAEAAGKA
jgi:zinc transport system ATP-binding protein